MNTWEIPERLKSDHLFLLIGNNPLPNWVALRLLLRSKQSQIYLIHSPETRPVAAQLASLAVKRGYRQPEYIPISVSAVPGADLDAEAIFNAVAPKVSDLSSGTIGLNYTGGKKGMAVHAYRAVEHHSPPGVAHSPIFSYLDGPSLRLLFDPYGGLRQSAPSIWVGLHPDAKVTIRELLALQDVGADINHPLGYELKRLPIALSVAQAIANLYLNETSYREWNRFISEAQGSKNVLTLEWSGVALQVAEEIAAGESLTLTLDEICRIRYRKNPKEWPFRNRGQLLSWLNGEWLESYLLHFLRTHQTDYLIDDYAQDLDYKLSSGSLFQADVIGVRGYQIFLLSCYRGYDKDTTKLKLMEAYIRARQMGGDEASAALVCMYPNAREVEKDVLSTLGTGGRIKVFGRQEFPLLADHLGEWFRQGIPATSHNSPTNTHSFLE